MKKLPGLWTRSDTNQARQTKKIRFRKKRHHTIYEAKTKVLISCAVTAQLISAFGFAHAVCSFSDAAAHTVYQSFILLSQELK